MEQSQVSILAVHVQRNELGSRMQLTDIVNRRKMRHGHMVNINRQMMLEGMRADFHKVDRLSSKVIDIVRNAKVVRATTTGGSDFTATLNPELQVAEDERPDQPRQVGQPARRRGLHHARERRRHARHRRRGRRFPVREVSQPRGDAADAPRQGQPPGRSAQREQRARERFLEVHAHRRQLAIASASSRSARTSS